ncbi:hypothetical protein PAXRUDRAFT_13082 [Paxillus rubicundulus Ve08.2h10]|uniref:Unplaced genomic scaffold scaffold_429, whole genome shotgun sequence n=1 Tax=Paxillus rubicundulus Ve08.2h10 TaxID=930991 RepID=A0A0D0DUG2_9AGAM|nr:hypothetical protein PAXRUDRAFT_13082 [Paxillus rubicundulus Ve08.2h10]
MQHGTNYNYIGKIYTALLVLVMQRLAVSAALARRQKLTSIHDTCGAWSGIGAAINSLWQQTKVAAAPSVILVILTYLGCISGLHIISSSIIQFQPFNGTMTSTIQSASAWPAPSVDISTLDWPSITPLAPMLPTLSGLSANGLTNSTLYDIPSVKYPFTKVVVNGATVSAECGLLSNTSVVTLDNLEELNATISGLGQITLPPGGTDNTILFLPLSSPGAELSCPLCGDYLFYSVSTAIEFGDLTSSNIVQSHTNATLTPGDGEQVPIPTTSYFVACSLNATTTPYDLDTASGQLVSPVSSSNDFLPWTVWSPGQSTELTTALNSAFANASKATMCQSLQLSGSVDTECAVVSMVDIHNVFAWHRHDREVRNSCWFSDYPRKTKHGNAISQVVAELIWLAGEVDASGGGFRRIEVESPATQQVLELRLNVVVGLCASIILLALAIGMLRSPSKTQLPTVTTAGLLELMWISAHSSSLRNHVRGVKDSSLDRLREEGMVDVCLADIHSTTSQDAMEDGRFCDETVTLSMDPEIEIPAVKLEESALEAQGHKGHGVSSIGSFTLWWWSYILHGILVALHVVLLVLLMHHPEHRVVISLDTAVMTTGLSILLQTFYTLYTAGLVFVTQRLALSRFIARRQYLTAVHDISSAWPGIGAAISAVWAQRRVASSTWMTIAVMIYLGCISTLHIASSTVMQFTAFNSTITTSVQSSMAWPGPSVNLTGLNWVAAVSAVPSMDMLSDLSTYGLSNNTLYDTLTTADPLFVNATVNATSLQASCRLLSNLTYNVNPDTNSTHPTHYVNFSVSGLGSGAFALLPESPNEILFVDAALMYLLEDPGSPDTACPLCDQYLFFVLTTGVDLDGSIDSTIGFSVNYTPSANPSSVTSYLAACSLEADTVTATLDVQDGKLDLSPSQIQTDQQPWSLWSPGGSANLTNAMSNAFGLSNFLDCPAVLNTMCINVTTFGSALFPPQSDPSALVALSPYQLEQAITQTAAEMLWLAGQAGEERAGFQRASGESQVIQMITRWRLNINTIPVLFASTASLVLFVIVFFLVGRPSRRCTSVSGVSVLEALWIAAHSQVLHERMADIDDASLDNLRAAGMFGICIADVQVERSSST